MTVNVESYVVNRNRVRQYPALVNCTTIDWFTEWPADALLEVAERYLEKIQLKDEEVILILIFLSLIKPKVLINKSSYFCKRRCIFPNWECLHMLLCICHPCIQMWDLRIVCNCKKSGMVT